MRMCCSSLLCRIKLQQARRFPYRCNRIFDLTRARARTDITCKQGYENHKESRYVEKRCLRLWDLLKYDWDASRFIKKAINVQIRSRDCP